MADQRLRLEEREAATGDPAARLRLLYDRVRCGAPLLDQKQYDGLAKSHKYPHNSRFVSVDSWGEPRDPEAGEINKVLLAIFNDEDLHQAVRVYGKGLHFAQYSPPADKHDAYQGYWNLTLDPEQKMVLIRREPIPGRWHARYDLFTKGTGVFYVAHWGDDSERYKGVLAANDIRCQEGGVNLPPGGCLTADQILQSLDETVNRMIRDSI